jgi:hypothetical protein
MSDYHRFRDRFAEAMDPRLHDLLYLDRLLFSGKAQIWFDEDAAIITEVREYPTGARVIHGVVAAGGLEEITDALIPKAEEWARSIGCVLAIVESREGWSRALRRQGYETHQVAVRKAL